MAVKENKWAELNKVVNKGIEKIALIIMEYIESTLYRAEDGSLCCKIPSEVTSNNIYGDAVYKWISDFYKESGIKVNWRNVGEKRFVKLTPIVNEK